VVAVVIHVCMTLVGARGWQSGHGHDLSDPCNISGSADWLGGGCEGGGWLLEVASDLALGIFNVAVDGVLDGGSIGWSISSVGSASLGARRSAFSNGCDLELWCWVGGDDGVAAWKVLAWGINLLVESLLLVALGSSRAGLEAWASSNVVVAPLALRAGGEELRESARLPSVEEVGVVSASGSITVGEDKSAWLDLVNDRVEVVLVLREDVRDTDGVGAGASSRLRVALGVGVVSVGVLWVKVLAVPAVRVVDVGVETWESLAVGDALWELSVLADDVARVGVAVPLNDTVSGRGTVGWVTSQSAVAGGELKGRVQFVASESNITVVQLVRLDWDTNVARAVLGLHVHGRVPVYTHVGQVLPSIGGSQVGAAGLEEGLVGHLWLESAGAEKLVHVGTVVSPVDNRIDTLNSGVITTRGVHDELVAHGAGGHHSCRSSKHCRLHGENRVAVVVEGE